MSEKNAEARALAEAFLALGRRETATAMPAIRALDFPANIEELIASEMAATYAFERTMAAHMGHVLDVIEEGPGAGRAALQAAINPLVGAILTMLNGATPVMRLDFVTRFYECLDEGMARMAAGLPQPPH